MPEKQTLQRARQAKRTGKKPTTQASEFVREEVHHLKQGRHGPESREQAIAIGLSKARRAGVDLKPPAPGRASRKTRQSARSAYRLGQEEGELSDTKRTSSRRSTTGRKRATARKSTPARKRTTTRGTKTGGRTAAAGRTGRAKTASRRGTTRRGSSTSRSRTSSRTKK